MSKNELEQTPKGVPSFWVSKEMHTPRLQTCCHMREPNKPQIPIQRNASSNSCSLLLAEESNCSNVTWGSNGAHVYEDGFGGSLRVLDELQLGALRKRIISAFSYR